MLSLLRRWRRWLEAVRTRRELRALDDRRLRDLGLSRAQVESLFR